MPVSFSDLQFAFEFVSSGGIGENEAYLDRQSGKIYWHSEFGDNDEELPHDIDNEKYIAIPDKRELDLGKPLVMDFVREFLPTTTKKCARSSAEEVLPAGIAFCWCGVESSNGGTIFRASPRRQLYENGARRTGSNSARPELTPLRSTVALTKACDMPEPVQLRARSCTDPSQKGRS
jgi:hypothetical protein